MISKLKEDTTSQEDARKTEKDGGTEGRQQTERHDDGGAILSHL